MVVAWFFEKETGMSFDVERYREERHHNKLPTPQIRKQYAMRMAEALQQATFALNALAAELEADPDAYLARAFTPTTLMGYEDEFQQIEIFRSAKGLAVRCTAQSDEPFKQIAFRVEKKPTDSFFRSTMDDHC